MLSVRKSSLKCDCSHMIFTCCFRAFLASHKVQLTDIAPLSLTVMSDSLLGSVWKSMGKWKLVSRFPIEGTRLLRNSVWKFGHSKTWWCGESGVMQHSRHMGACTLLSAFCTEYVKSWNLRQCPWRKCARVHCLDSYQSLSTPMWITAKTLHVLRF